MTTVDALLERQLPALEDLHESGILSREELRRVVERRRDFEFIVQARAPKKVCTACGGFACVCLLWCSAAIPPGCDLTSCTGCHVVTAVRVPTIRQL